MGPLASFGAGSGAWQCPGCQVWIAPGVREHRCWTEAQGVPLPPRPTTFPPGTVQADQALTGRMNGLDQLVNQGAGLSAMLSQLGSLGQRGLR